jgi:hypothetical protein
MGSRRRINLDAAGAVAEVATEPKQQLDDVYRNHGDYLTQRSTEQFFKAVISSYRELRGWAPVVSVNHDPMAMRKKWSAGSIHYCVDVEKATRDVLCRTPGLMIAWAHLILGRKVPAAIKKQVIHACGRVYAKRGLHPKQYFRKSYTHSSERAKRASFSWS